MIFRIFTCIFAIYGYTTNSQRNQLLVSLTIKLVEHCTGIKEVTGSNPVQDFVFRLQSHNYLSCGYNCDDQSCLPKRNINPIHVGR